MKTIKFITDTFSAYFIFLILVSCTSLDSAFLPPPRTITLNGIDYSEEKYGPFESWVCHKSFSDEILLEFGTFGDTNLARRGFVLYDGTNSGELTHYQRKGINRRWDWGPNETDFAFIIEPEGTGLFYDFTKLSFFENKTKASSVYKCYRR